MEIKICGITREQEADYLNSFGADYAGFVFYEKSKRNVTIAQAQSIVEKLNPNITSVAVTVSPEAAQARELEKAGFSILQVHKNLSRQVLETVNIPIWYAINLADDKELDEKIQLLEELPPELAGKITAVVVDGAAYGSGKTFDWQKSKRLKKAGAQSPPELFGNRKFVLAGGLTSSNVQEGISIFHPDIVDVSSGVEDKEGKNKKLIQDFIRKVREYE